MPTKITTGYKLGKKTITLYLPDLAITTLATEVDSCLMGNAVVSNPPEGQYYVKNLYVNPDGKLVTEYDDVPKGELGEEKDVCSQPPVGNYYVTNLYVNPANGRMIVKYDDKPVT